MPGRATHAPAARWGGACGNRLCRHECVHARAGAGRPCSRGRTTPFQACHCDPRRWAATQSRPCVAMAGMPLRCRGVIFPEWNYISKKPALMGLRYSATPSTPAGPPLAFGGIYGGGAPGWPPPGAAPRGRRSARCAPHTARHTPRTARRPPRAAAAGGARHAAHSARHMQRNAVPGAPHPARGERRAACGAPREARGRTTTDRRTASTDLRGSCWLIAQLACVAFNADLCFIPLRVPRAAA